MFSNLLVPLDGSKLAESVLPIVKKLARRLACAVKLLHVIEKHAPSTIHGDTHLRDVAGAEGYMSLIAERLRGWGLQVSSHVHTVPQGDIPKCIAEHAEELEQDLVVLCAHGTGGFKRFVFGTNAQQVLTHGKTPVLLVKTDEFGRTPRFGPESILALLDKTPENDAVLAACSELANIFGARLHILYVVPTVSSIKPPDAPGGKLVPSATRLLLDIEAEEIAARVREELARLTALNVDSSGSVERGETGPAVVAAAAGNQADMVAMATSGLTGLSALWAKDLLPLIYEDFNGVLLLFPASRD